MLRSGVWFCCFIISEFVLIGVLVLGFYRWKLTEFNLVGTVLSVGGVEAVLNVGWEDSVIYFNMVCSLLSIFCEFLSVVCWSWVYIVLFIKKVWGNMYRCVLVIIYFWSRFCDIESVGFVTDGWCLFIMNFYGKRSGFIFVDRFLVGLSVNFWVWWLFSWLIWDLFGMFICLYVVDCF